jgi:hypothetical protein
MSSVLQTAQLQAHHFWFKDSTPNFQHDKAPLLAYTRQAGTAGIEQIDASLKFTAGYMSMPKNHHLGSYFQAIIINVV